ncbi:MAG: ankyrin repeat domain-containing protein, partial [bacterium]
MGRCPLLFAIDCGMDLIVIKRLVEEGGCDPKSADSFGDTALHYAVNLD